MMMPFGSAYAINNLKVTPAQLPLLFMVAGCGSLTVMPLLGRLSDRMDKSRLFAMASIHMMGIVLIYTNLNPQPLWIIMALNVLMMAGILGRMIPSSALATAIPEIHDRGAFMSINASVQQISGGVAAAVAGMIVVQKTKFSPLEHYNTLGFIVMGISCISILLMFRVSRMIKSRTGKARREEERPTFKVKGVN
jgi:MFS family permease